MTQSNSFPKPTAYAATEVPSSLAGWEAMYPSHFFFGGVREEWENRHFWYLDKIHAPYPLPPLDHIFQQAWQISLSQHTTRVFCIPPAQGIAQRIVGCYQYICAVEPPPDEVIGEKAALFQARAHYPVEHYSELWDEWLGRVQTLGGELKNIHVPSELPRYVPDSEMFPDGFKGYTAAYELMESFSRAVDCLYKGWQYHFNYLNLAYLYYLTFFGAAKTLFPGVSDAAVSKMVAGADVSMFRPDAELCRLARLAYEDGPVAAVLEREETAAEKIVSLREIQSGRDWLDEFDKIRDPWLHISTGSGWYYNEGSWLNKLDVPFGYIKNYIERLQNGERIERSLDEIGVAREALVGEYRTLIRTDEDRTTFDNAYNDTRIIYKYAEDHLFWIEHWFHTLWWDKIREIGEVLVKAGSLKKVDDIFMFNRFEVPALIEDSATRWALGEGVPSMDWAGTATKRLRHPGCRRQVDPVSGAGPDARRGGRALHDHALGRHHRQGGRLAQGLVGGPGRPERDQGLRLVGGRGGRHRPRAAHGRRDHEAQGRRDPGVPVDQPVVGTGARSGRRRGDRHRRTHLSRRHRGPRVWVCLR